MNYYFFDLSFYENEIKDGCVNNWKTKDLILRHIDAFSLFNEIKTLSNNINM